MAGLKRLATSLWLAFVAVQLLCCQFPNYNLLPADGPGGDGGTSPGASGSSPAAGASSGGDGGSAGSSQPPVCEESQACLPVAPAGWLGPVALWQGESGEDLPDCPAGYGNPADLHASPSGDPAECSCTCTAMDQTCDGVTSVTIYGDLGCQDACETVTEEGCSAVSDCSGNSVSISVPLVEPAGRCEVAVTKQVGSIQWQQDARLCELEQELEACGAEQTCVPTPSPPFASQLCVYRVVRAGQDAPPCPDSYPNGPESLFTSFEDERDCGECDCSGPSGGECGGHVNVSNNGCDAGVPYDIGTGCKQLQLQGDKPSSVSVDYTMKPGTCGVASPPEPIGEAVPSGNFRAVCCL